MKNFKDLYEAIILTTIPTSDSVGTVNKTEEPEKICEPCDNFSKNVADFLGNDITQPDDNIGEPGEIDSDEVQNSDDVTETEDGSISIKLSEDGNELVLNAEVLAKIKAYLGVEETSETSDEGEVSDDTDGEESFETDEASENESNDEKTSESENESEIEDSDNDFKKKLKNQLK